MHLATARLDLWPCTLDDVDALCALWRDPAVRKLLWDDRTISRREAEEVVLRCIESGDQHGLYLWTVDARTTHELVGFVALREMTLATEIELFYGLMPKFWGQGYATEAAAAALKYGFEVLSLPRIWARTDPPNVVSQRVAQRLGMRSADDPDITSYVSFVIERQDFGR